MIIELLRYSWAICGGICLLIINFQMPLSLKWYINEGYLTENEVKKFRYRMSLAIFVPCVLLQIFQLAGGYDEPTYFLIDDLSSSWRIVGSAVVIVCWGLLLYWLWFREGAEYLSRFSPALYLPKEAKYIRIILSLVVFFLISFGLLKYFIH